MLLCLKLSKSVRGKCMNKQSFDLKRLFLGPTVSQDGQTHVWCSCDWCLCSGSTEDVLCWCERRVCSIHFHSSKVMIASDGSFPQMQGACVCVPPSACCLQHPFKLLHERLMYLLGCLNLSPLSSYVVTVHCTCEAAVLAHCRNFPPSGSGQQSLARMHRQALKPEAWWPSALLLT